MSHFLNILDPILACAVCVGNPDHAVTLGMNMAIGFMVVVVGGVLGCFLTFIAHLARTAKRAARDGEEINPRPALRSGSRGRQALN